MGIFDFMAQLSGNETTGEAAREDEKKYANPPPGIWENIASKGQAAVQWRQAENEAQQGKAYAGLLDKYRTGSSGELPLGNTAGELDAAIARGQGGFRQGDGTIANMPPAQFFAEAAALPKYSGLAVGAQNQQGAMARQVQQQLWDADNMTAAQKATKDIQLQQMEWQKESEVWGRNNMTAAQRASNAVAQGHLGIAQQQLGLQRQESEQRRTATPPLNFAQQQEVQTAYGNTQNALNTLGDIEKAIAGGKAPGFVAGAAGTAQAKQFQQNFEAAMVPIVTKMFKPSGDAPSESELKQIKAYIGDLTSMGTDKGKLERIKQLKQDVAQYWNPYNRFGAMPSYQAGRSSYAKSYPSGVIPRPEGLTAFEVGQ